MTNSNAIKIIDSDNTITAGSRADLYWQQNGWENLFNKMRKGIGVPKKFSNDLSGISKRFNLKGIGFGNWLSIEDKINYTYSLVYSLYDLNKVLHFNYNIGFGLLIVTFGARGRGSALAHYEPNTQYINITRYKRGSEDKRIRFFNSGGVGSLAHEYGHFLDYFAGEYLAPSKEYFALTNGSSIAKGRTDTKNKMRTITDDIMQKIIWSKKRQLSKYYLRLLDILNTTDKGNYWIQRNEMFARAFEVYVSEKLKKQGVSNILLTHTKYVHSVYLRPSEIKPIMPLFDALLTEIRKKIK